MLTLLFIPQKIKAVDVPAKTGFARTVRVGIYEAGSLANFDKDGSAHGFFVDMLNHIAEKEQWNLQYVPGSWQEGLDRLKSDKIDLVLCIGYTAEREKYMDFPKEYLLLNWGVLYRQKGSHMTSLLELEGKSVSALKGDVYLTGFLDLVRQFNVNVKIEEVDQYSKVFKAVESGAVTAGVAGNLYGILNENGRRAEQTPIIFAPIKVGYAVNEGKNGDLIEALDRNIMKMKADKTSIYHHELEHLLGKKGNGIPKEAYWVLSGVAAALLLAITFILLLRRQVKAKTEHLKMEIAEHKQAKEALLESEGSFRKLFEESSDAILLIDDSGVFVECNQAALDLLKMTRAQFLLLPPARISPEYQPDGRRSAESAPEMIALAYSKGLHRFDWTCVNAEGGEFIVEVSLMPVTIKGKTMLHTTWRDATERKRAEEERLNFEKQLLHAQKLESLGVLAGGIAHDFNNLLMAIMGNADLALMRLNPESPVVDNLKRIEQAAARAADLARQMLAYSGKGKFVIEHLDLSRLVEEMLHMLEVSISKKAVLRFNLTSPIPSIEADATQLRQIIMNLVINASEAIGDRSGVIAITTGCMDCGRSYLKDVWLDENLTEGLYVYLEIADSGCGMDKQTLSKLFDPFFTTKFTGRGLGMAAVLGIVRGHKGAIKVYSELNKGTSFKVLFPASSRPAELFNGKSLMDDWQGSGTVLLIDDEETVRGIGKEMLRELGFSVITADDGLEGVAAFKENPDIAFVILDLTMPHMDGEQCFRELRQMNPDVKVIMSSGYNEQEVTQKFVGKGLAGFIQKPYSLSVLKDAVRGIL